MNQVKIRKIVKTRKRETITKESRLRMTMSHPLRTRLRIKSRKQKPKKLKKLSNKPQRNLKEDLRKSKLPLNPNLSIILLRRPPLKTFLTLKAPK